eukprot:5175605-Pyramimonas_sp.AAC.1
MLELCGGSGGISELAPSRGMSPRGNLDERSCVDFGNVDVQDAVMRYQDMCFVKVVILQPNCRTTGPPSYLDSQVNFGTRHEHRKGDLPHIKFCYKVAVRQSGLRRFYLREQPVGTWVDQMPPWTT